MASWFALSESPRRKQNLTFTTSKVTKESKDPENLILWRLETTSVQTTSSDCKRSKPVEQWLYDLLVLQISSERETFRGLNWSLMGFLGAKKPLMPSSRGTCKSKRRSVWVKEHSPLVRPCGGSVYLPQSRHTRRRRTSAGSPRWPASWSPVQTSSRCSSWARDRRACTCRGRLTPCCL